MSKIEEQVIEKIKLRAETGEKKYNTTMERTDLSRLDWLVHAQEEAMDMAIYLEKLIELEIRESVDVEPNKADEPKLISELKDGDTVKLTDMQWNGEPWLAIIESIEMYKDTNSIAIINFKSPWNNEDKPFTFTLHTDPEQHTGLGTLKQDDRYMYALNKVRISTEY